MDSKHKIAIIGKSLFVNLNDVEFAIDGYEFEYYDVQSSPNSKRLSSFTLCIVDYNAFNNLDLQSNFIIQFLEAVEIGVNFCCVNYKDVPYSNSATKSMPIGYAIADKVGLFPEVTDIYHEGIVKKQEFAPFLKRFGVSNFKFEIRNDKAKSLFMSPNEFVLGAVVPFKKAEVVFVPFIRTGNVNETKEGVLTLVDNLLSYFAKSRTEPPEWAKSSSFFVEEEEIADKIAILENELVELNNEVSKFDTAKSLLFHSEYELEKTLPNFLVNFLGLKIDQKETYKEDFWLLDENDNRIAICEIKSKIKGFSRNLVGHIIAHRDEYELDDEFPAILFVNCNLQAGGWKEKDKPLSDQEYNYVAYNNVLVIRVEDLVRLWDLKRQEKIDSNEILKLFLTKKGWLQVNKDLKINSLPKN